MRTIIIGRNGFIGKKMIRQFDSSGADYMVLSREDHGFNLADAGSFDYTLLRKGDVVLFLSAVSSPEECSKNYESVYQINVVGTSYFIRKALDMERRMMMNCLMRRHCVALPANTAK